MNESIDGKARIAIATPVARCFDHIVPVKLSHIFSYLACNKPTRRPTGSHPASHAQSSSLMARALNILKENLETM